MQPAVFSRTFQQHLNFFYAQIFKRTVTSFNVKSFNDTKEANLFQTPVVVQTRKGETIHLNAVFQVGSVFQINISIFYRILYLVDPTKEL